MTNDGWLVPDREASTKMERAYWALRRAIVTGDIPEGAPLDDAELMVKFGVGRTPIREAVKRLALEEMVIWPSHRTPYVRTTSVYDLTQIYEARHIFEIPAVRRAAERATEADIDAMAGHCEDFDEAEESRKMYEVAEFDYAFHLAVAKASNNRFLVDAVGHLNCGALRLWYHSYIDLGTDRIGSDHRRILEAIRAHDPEEAETVGREHIRFSHHRQLILYLQGSNVDQAATTGPQEEPPEHVIRTQVAV